MSARERLRTCLCRLRVRLQTRSLATVPRSKYAETARTRRARTSGEVDVAVGEVARSLRVDPNLFSSALRQQPNALSQPHAEPLAQSTCSPRACGSAASRSACFPKVRAASDAHRQAPPAEQLCLGLSASLVRFAGAEDGKGVTWVVPDPGARLPGRGVYTLACARTLSAALLTPGAHAHCRAALPVSER